MVSYHLDNMEVVLYKIRLLRCTVVHSITVKPRHFVYTFSQRCCTTTTVGNVVLEKNVQDIWRAGLNWLAGRMRPTAPLVYSIVD